MAVERGASTIYLAPAARPTRAQRVPVPPGTIAEIGFDRAGTRLAYSLSSAVSHSEVYVVDVRSPRRPVRWARGDADGLAPDAFSTPSLVEYPSFDGKAIPAWIYRPRRPGRKPVIVLFHGGPEGQHQPSFNATLQYIVNDLGAVVIAPNVRGSGGHGKSWLVLDDGPKRKDAVKDVGALLDWIGKQPDLDASRVGVYGHSYGGFMALAAVIAYPERVRCAVDVSGMSNLITFIERSEPQQREGLRSEYGDERDPGGRAVLAELSPLTHAASIRSPLFVVQGESDLRVPADEAETLVATARRNGAEVWYLVGRDEGHGFHGKGNRDVLGGLIGLFFANHLIR
jgi:dipeptidyl aminopeptidase/acylaminoacyl peptidase